MVEERASAHEPVAGAPLRVERETGACERPDVYAVAALRTGAPASTASPQIAKPPSASPAPTIPVDVQP